uniref:C2 calcium-dependent domain containing 5 n=1 Tax=Jaculus jaculus TaxID=51337 RepID=A0A8C5LBG0_JACJA
MPGKLKVKIVAGRHLPVMDRASDLTDAFVEVKFGNTTFKTDVYLKSLNPQWNSEWFKFEVSCLISAVFIVFLIGTNLVVFFGLLHTKNHLRAICRFESMFCSFGSFVFWRQVSGKRIFSLSVLLGELQRKIGLKVLEMRGNAVVGYLQCFDLEGESGLVVRAIGTACTLDKLSSPTAFLPACNSPSTEMKEIPFSEDPNPNTHSSGPSTPLKNQTHSFSPSKPYSRQSSCSDTDLSLTPKTGMASGSAGKEGGPMKALLRQQTQSALEQREFPFFTLTAFPPGFLVHVGGVVSARSVKLLDRIHNPGMFPKTRAFTVVLYVNCAVLESYFSEQMKTKLKEVKQLLILNFRKFSEGRIEGVINSHVCCGFCHIPYDELNMPFPAHLTYCCNCRKQKVPDVLFTTIDLPAEATVVGKGCLIQARLCRLKKKAQAEANATAISNLLPFMEYEVHTQLMTKLKLRGMNAVFGLRTQVSVGETMVMGLASATGVYLAALPMPGGIQIAGKTPNDGSYEQHISHIQKKINDMIAKNKELYEINPEVPEEIIGSPIPEPRQRSRLLRSQSESSDEVAELDLSHGKKDAFVLEIDDTDAMEDVHSLLTDVPPPSGFYSCNTEIMPGINNWTSEIQMFTSVRVVRLSSLNLTNQALNKNFNDLCENLLKSLYFKLRSMTPCCLCHVNFTVSLPEDELIQVTVTAVAITFDKNQTLQTAIKPHVGKSLQRASTDNEELLQFPLELCSDSLPSHPFPPAKEHVERASANSGRPAAQRAVTIEKASPLGEGTFRNRSAPHCTNSTVGVVKMTPLSFIPGAKITKYLGIINMFFIRETTSLREEGGVSGFLHAFIAEVFAMVRAHVAALGGNAVVSYIMKQCVFMENPNKNQAQCLINVSGDAVVFVRESDLEVVSTQQPPVSCQPLCSGEDVTT